VEQPAFCSIFYESPGRTGVALADGVIILLARRICSLLETTHCGQINLPLLANRGSAPDAPQKHASGPSFHQRSRERSALRRAGQKICMEANALLGLLHRQLAFKINALLIRTFSFLCDEQGVAFYSDRNHQAKCAFLWNSDPQAQNLALLPRESMPNSISVTLIGGNAARKLWFDLGARFLFTTPSRERRMESELYTSEPI
jgi:hypothetical protein